MDFSAFTEPVTAAERAQYKNSPYLNMKQTNQVIWITMIAAGVVLGIMLMGVMIGMSEQLGGASIVLAVLAMILFPGLSIPLARTSINRRLDFGIRLMKFGMRNNLVVYMNVPGTANYPGLIFQEGYEKTLDHWVSASDGSYVVANYRYTVGTQKNRRVIRKHFMMIKLPRKLPNMVLDAKKNNLNAFGRSLLSNLPASFDKDQTLSLEGNFDQYFTLYAPREYERDALYVFTPDLMALFMDNAAQHDAEIIDDMLFIYGEGYSNLQDQNVWLRFLRIKDVVGKKLINQSDYYADERVGNRAMNEVAAGGRRLKHSISWVAIVGIVLYVLYFVLSILDISLG